LKIFVGFEEAIVGTGVRVGSPPFVVYDYQQCVNILISNSDMSIDEAVEFLEYNVVNSYVGEDTPVFLTKASMNEMEMEMEMDWLGDPANKDV
jgi:hypothetical protein